MRKEAFFERSALIKELADFDMDGLRKTFAAHLKFMQTGLMRNLEGDLIDNLEKNPCTMLWAAHDVFLLIEKMQGCSDLEATRIDAFHDLIARIALRNAPAKEQAASYADFLLGKITYVDMAIGDRGFKTSLAAIDDGDSACPI